MSSTFTIGGKTAKELGMRMLRTSQRPILPGTRDRILDLSGKHGAWDMGADLQPRLFLLECAFITKNPVELQQRISDLAAHFTDVHGNPRTMSLSFSLRPDVSYTARYSGSLPIDRIAGIGRFTIPLVAYDPFAYSDNKITEVTITESPEEFEIYSDGNKTTSPVIVLTNTGNNTIHGFKIRNEYEVE